MDLLRVIEDLRRERDDIAEAIRSLERLATATTPKKRGRPPNKAKALQIARRIQASTMAKGLRQQRPY